jgi:hypothetical protein
MEASTQISKEGLGSQAVCVVGSGSLQAAPERGMGEAVMAKPELYWRPQKVEAVRNLQC